ncbi:MAG: hypothetical protein Q6L68_04710, partial [Thermostichus sp. DG02_5_bins_236]
MNGRILSFFILHGMPHRRVFYIDGSIMVTGQFQTAHVATMPTVLNGLWNLRATTRAILGCAAWIYC